MGTGLAKLPHQLTGGVWLLVSAAADLPDLGRTVLTPYDAVSQVGELLMPPSWDPSGHVEFFFGTDDLGRDILSRLLMGTRLTFGYAILIALCSGVIGIAIGVMAGMSRGLKSSFLNHLLDTVLSIPSLLLAIIVVAYMGPGEYSILLAIWLALIPRFIRAVYTAVHNEVEKDYIMLPVWMARTISTCCTTRSCRTF